jgi:hypothetical protein
MLFFFVMEEMKGNGTMEGRGCETGSELKVKNTSN